MQNCCAKRKKDNQIRASSISDWHSGRRTWIKCGKWIKLRRLQQLPGATFDDKIRQRNATEKGLKSTKTLEELRLSLSAKTQKIGNVEKTKASVRETAEETVENREQELRRIRTQTEGPASLGKFQRHIQKVRRHRDCGATGRWHRHRSNYRYNYDLLKALGQRPGQWFKWDWQKKIPPAQPHRLESKLYSPSCWASDQLSGQTHMAVDPWFKWS